MAQRIMKLLTSLLIGLVMVGMLASCSTELATYSGVNFEESPYKHVNNGGLTGGDDELPYNIDAITGATMTVEGPGVQTSIPLSVREIENENEGLHRAEYKDDTGVNVYEGMNLLHVIENMQEGENGIILTDSAYSVLLKDMNRKDLVSFTLEEIKEADNQGRPILIAYGIGTRDQETIAPFVYDAKNKETHSEGYVPELDNEDGCMKLVYDLDEYGDNPDYQTFSNVAYVYIQEETEPGFKHTYAGNEFEQSRYVDYVITFTGEHLGYEVPLTVRQLEEMIATDDSGNLIEGGLGYRDEYSLANNAYWYVNEYEGLDLYKLITYLGAEGAEDLDLATARKTLVTFKADDGRVSPESFSLDTLSHPDTFGFYKKNAADPGDGSYIPHNDDLEDTGYPVLLAYGVNNYPYTISKNDDGYLSGLGNSGGPIRVVFGKTQYSHPNGSNQVQYLRDVVIGKDIPYSTHAASDDAAVQELANQQLPFSISVEKDGAVQTTDSALTVGSLADLIYGPDVDPLELDSIRVKDLFEVEQTDGYETDVYEGVSIEYLLRNVFQAPGTSGTITFKSDSDELTVSLDEVLSSGYNAELTREGLQPIIAFAKNGAPLVTDESASGYVDQRTFNPTLDHEPASFEVDNQGGPLMVIIPSTSTEQQDARSLKNVQSIDISIEPDPYAHIGSEYADLAQQTIRFYGEGLEQEMEFSVSDIESRQWNAITRDLSVKDGDNFVEERYRGIPIFDLFTEIGIKTNAADVIVHSADGTTQQYSLASLRKPQENFIAEHKQKSPGLLAFGKGDVEADTLIGMPLVASDADAHYNAEFDNQGGPIKLIVPQQDPDEDNAPLFLSDVAAVEVTANEMDSWGHKMGDIYAEFLEAPLTLRVVNDDSSWERTFTVAELEEMSDLITRDTYTVLDLGEMEGLSLWKFIQRYTGEIDGIDDPISVTVYASDGYKNDLLSVFGLSALQNGIDDEEGTTKDILMAYARGGYPLVDDENHEGYTGLAGNADGPLRIVTEGNQGASVKYLESIVITVPGSGPITGKED